MSQNPIDEINGLLKEGKRVIHAASGEAIGGLSDTMTAILTQIGQRWLQSQNDNLRLRKENEELKKKVPEKSKK